MKIRPRGARWLGAGLLWVAASAQALVSPDRADLPALPMAVAAMSSHPLVLAAQAGVSVERANSDRLRAGPHEYAVRSDLARRRVGAAESVGAGGYMEWGLALERTVRLPGKARLDALLADQGVSAAELALGDALHETGRLLLRQWFGWLRERTQRAQWQAQVAVLGELVRTTQRRVQAGDASRLELNLAEAAVAQAEVAAAQAASREQAAAADLTQQFPLLVLPADPVLLAPVLLEGDLGRWRDMVLEENHELAFARAQTKRQQAQAERALAERRPDPLVGVRYASDRGGGERVAGVYLSVPLGSAARDAGARGALAQVDVAAQNEAAVLRKVSAEVGVAWARAMGSYQAWQAAQQAAQRLQRNAELTTRAYRLGEAPLADVLLARRTALEGELAALASQADAAESRYRLLLDAHELWPLDAVGSHGHAR